MEKISKLWWQTGNTNKHQRISQQAKETIMAKTLPKTMRKKIEQPWQTTPTKQGAQTNTKTDQNKGKRQLRQEDCEKAYAMNRSLATNKTGKEKAQYNAACNKDQSTSVAHVPDTRQTTKQNKTTSQEQEAIVCKNANAATAQQYNNTKRHCMVTQRPDLCVATTTNK